MQYHRNHGAFCWSTRKSITNHGQGWYRRCSVSSKPSENAEGKSVLDDRIESLICSRNCNRGWMLKNFNSWRFGRNYKFYYSLILLQKRSHVIFSGIWRRINLKLSKSREIEIVPFDCPQSEHTQATCSEKASGTRRTLNHHSACLGLLETLSVSFSQKMSVWKPSIWIEK